MSDVPSPEETKPPLPANDVDKPKSDGFARRTLLRRLMDVVALPASRGNYQDRAIAGDILLEMLIESDVASRELCARRLQEMSQAPKRLLRFLALDAPHVAQLILADNKAFDDADLAHIVQNGGPAHRLAISHRKDIGPAVATAIAESGDIAAMRGLLENNQSKLSERSVDLMVSASRKARDLTPLLIEREEIRPAHALAMFWWAEAAERRHILLRFSAERTLLVEMCSDIFRHAAGEGFSDPVVRKALQVIERRQRNRAAIEKSPYENLEGAVSAAVVSGIDDQMMTEIAYLSGIKPTTAERIFQDPGGEGIAILCKATGLKRNYLKDLWTALGRAKEGDDLDYNRVSEIFETIAVAKAQTVLRYWNWSLSSAYSPDEVEAEEEDPDTIARTMRMIDEAVRPRAAQG